MIYKKQLRKALSRGLRGKPNNVPGLYGRVFYRIGVEAVGRTSDWCFFAKSFSRGTEESCLVVKHGDRFLIVRLDVFFYDFDYVKKFIK